MNFPVELAVGISSWFLALRATVRHEYVRFETEGRPGALAVNVHCKTLEARDDDRPHVPAGYLSLRTSDNRPRWPLVHCSVLVITKFDVPVRTVTERFVFRAAASAEREMLG
jgi:hypothetical protein